MKSCSLMCPILGRLRRRRAPPHTRIATPTSDAARHLQPRERLGEQNDREHGGDERLQVRGEGGAVRPTGGSRGTRGRSSRRAARASRTRAAPRPPSRGPVLVGGLRQPARAGARPRPGARRRSSARASTSHQRRDGDEYAAQVAAVQRPRTIPPRSCATRRRPSRRRRARPRPPRSPPPPRKRPAARSRARGRGSRRRSGSPRGRGRSSTPSSRRARRRRRAG